MMHSTINSLLSMRNLATPVSPAGWLQQDDYRQLDKVIIEAHSFHDPSDRTLSLYEPVDRLLPEADVLEKRGVNLPALARALCRGLSAAGFANALNYGLDCDLFFLALERGQLSLPSLNHDLAHYEQPEIDLFNCGLEHLQDLYESPRHRRWVHGCDDCL